LGLFLLLGTVTMCDPSSGDVCDAVCACEGCSGHDTFHCEVDFDTRAEHADYHGCEDYLVDYDECIADGRGCGNAPNGERRADFYCDVERDRYNNCVGH
jgi:hypothetical protein